MDDIDEELRDALESWEKHLEVFRKDVYPTFASYGLTFGEALLAYEMRTVTWAIQNLDTDEF